jgi:hypothetical protein
MWEGPEAEQFARANTPLDAEQRLRAS